MHKWGTKQCKNHYGWRTKLHENHYFLSQIGCIITTMQTGIHFKLNIITSTKILKPLSHTHAQPRAEQIHQSIPQRGWAASHSRPWYEFLAKIMYQFLNFCRLSVSTIFSAKEYLIKMLKWEWPADIKCVSCLLSILLDNHHTYDNNMNAQYNYQPTHGKLPPVWQIFSFNHLMFHLKLETTKLKFYNDTTMSALVRMYHQ